METKKNDYVEFSTPVFPVGGGIFLKCFSDSGIVIEGLYNIIPFKGRTTGYVSINVGYKYTGDS